MKPKTLGKIITLASLVGMTTGLITYTYCERKLEQLHPNSADYRKKRADIQSMLDKGYIPNGNIRKNAEQLSNHFDKMSNNTEMLQRESKSKKRDICGVFPFAALAFVSVMGVYEGFRKLRILNQGDKK